jgi:hypothetical protein
MFNLHRAVLPALLLSLLAVCVFVAVPSHAQTEKAGPTLEGAFQLASARWNVPVEVLLAVGYVESRWEERPGQPSIDNGYGIMHITDRPDGTLERAVALTGLSAETIRNEELANIEAGAALLSDTYRTLNATSAGQETLAAWYPVVAAYSGATDASVADGYAQEVFRVIREGQVATLSSGEVLALPPTGVGELPAPLVAPKSDDYPPALWVPAHSNNYTASRPYGPMNFIVIHDTEGSYASAISWFQNPNSGVSAHYVIRSSDGQITQMVRNHHTGYHAGNWDYNVRSIGIEHEGYMRQPGWYTEPMYQASAALSRYAADQLGIKKDRAHIIAHSEVPGATHQDPGPFWNWSYYMSLVRRDSARAALVDNTDSGFTAVPTPIDPQHYWWIHPGGYNNSNVYGTTSVVNQSSSYNSGTWRAWLTQGGTYDVYAYIPYVDNGTPDTSSARYQVYASDGVRTAVVSQRAITDRGVGSWAHVGAFPFNANAEARVSLSDWTGESGRMVWFDAVMWIPRSGSPPPPPPQYTPTRTPTPRPVSTATRTPTPLPTFTPTWSMTPAPTFTPGPCGMRFSDLPDSHWAYTHVAYLFCNGVISGYADGTFRPGETTTRGQLTKMLALGFGWTLYNPTVPSFSDVPIEHPFYVYVETALVRGVITGYSDGTFRPGNPVTRAQVTKMLVIAKGWEPLYPVWQTFNDVSPWDWAYGYVESAYSHGVITGYADGSFRPGVAVNRAQFSKMLSLTLQRVASSE